MIGPFIFWQMLLIIVTCFIKLKVGTTMVLFRRNIPTVSLTLN